MRIIKWFRDLVPPRLFGRGATGFTLIELLVVVAIIGLLASIVLVSLNTVRIRARDTRRRADLKQLQLALELYYDANNVYPVVVPPATTYAEGRCNPPLPGWTNQPNYTGAAAYIPNLAPAYVSVLPGDPAVSPSGRCYVYFSDTGQRYFIFAHFGAEESFDPQDPMIRLIAPACTVAQNTFFVANGWGRCI